MKKLILFLSAGLLFAGNVGATGGTCSWHNGVDCSAGADSDGSVICDDGWRDSTESYWQAKECLKDKHVCTIDQLYQFERNLDIEKLENNVKEKREALEKLENKLAEIDGSASSQSLGLEEQASVGGMNSPLFLSRQQAENNRKAAIAALEITPSINLAISEFKIASDKLKTAENQAMKLCYIKGEDDYRKEQYEINKAKVAFIANTISKKEDPVQTSVKPTREQILQQIQAITEIIKMLQAQLAEMGK